MWWNDIFEFDFKMWMGCVYGVGLVSMVCVLLLNCCGLVMVFFLECIGGSFVDMRFLVFELVMEDGKVSGDVFVKFFVLIC